METEKRYCIHCGELNPVNKRHPHLRRKKFCSELCRSRYDRINYGHKRRAILLSIHGGKCIKCGYSQCPAALQFHHRDPATKKFKLSTPFIARRDWRTVLVEANKCDLLCANCHAEHHYQEDLVKNGLTGEEQGV